MPESIQDAPALRADLAFYYQAYLDLSTTRPSGERAPLPWTAIRSYAETFFLVGEEGEEFIEIMARLDAEFLKSVESTSEGEKKP